MDGRLLDCESDMDVDVGGVVAMGASPDVMTPTPKPAVMTAMTETMHSRKSMPSSFVVLPFFDMLDKTMVKSLVSRLLSVLKFVSQ